MLERLRAKHPRLTYKHYQLTQTGRHVVCRFKFELEPDWSFEPEVSFEQHGPADLEKLAPFAFNLGMIELLSYWKAACPREILIEAGWLSPEQCDWWKDLLIYGMGEFFCKNKVDFTAPDFVNFTCTPSAPDHGGPAAFPQASGALILTAGGKDSAVTLELLADLEMQKTALALNPTRAALDSARIAGYRNPVVVRRTIDPLLLKLNASGYLNGHTPFSAYLAFCGTFAAALSNLKYAVVSNERSSSEPNTYFHGLPINHQYSKSLRFETLFRQYCAAHLSSDLEYFSFLRPLYDLQVAGIFAHYPRHFSSFRSCNVAQQSDAWCGRCSKCAFVYLSLFPFINSEVMREIFSKDLFEVPEIQKHIRGLLGLEEHKPFECVGTHTESRVALEMCISKFIGKDRELPHFLTHVRQEIEIANLTLSDADFSLSAIGEEHCMPGEFLGILIAAVDRCLTPYA